MIQINASQLADHLQKQVWSLYVLCGEEPLQQLESSNAIRRSAAINGGEVERSSFIVAGAHYDWSQVTAALSGLSLFSQQQIVEVSIPSGKPGREGGAVLQQLGQSVEQMEDILLVVSLPQALDRSTRNTAWFKGLTEHAVIVMCNPVEPHALSQWLVQRMAQVGLRMESAEEGKKAVSFLVEHVEGNLLAAHQEIEKMSLLYAATLDKPYAMSFDEVQRAVTDVARYDLFALPQAILSGQVGRAMKMLDGLISEGQAVVRIHWVLANEVSSLWRARQLLDEGKPMPIALREARIWGPRERLFEQVLPKVTSRECLRLLRFSQVCDGVTKGLGASGWPDNAAAALRKLVLEIIDVVGVRSNTAIAHSVALKA